MKKLIAFLTTLGLLLSLLPPVVFAENNMVQNPSFTKDVSSWTGRGGASVTWEANGYSGGCAKIKLVGNYSAMVQAIPFEAGNVYDISFCAKLEPGQSNTITVIQNFTDGGWNYLLSNEPLTDSWKKISIVYNCTGVNTAGGAVSGAGNFEFRIGDGKTTYTHYIDEVKITKRADANDDEEEEEVSVTPAPEKLPTYIEPKEVSFADTVGHWSEPIVTLLASAGYVAGKSANVYEPDGLVTRAEFVKLLIDGIRLETRTYDDRFLDVSAEDWYADYVLAADELGLIPAQMKLNKRFLPSRPISREEAGYMAGVIAERKNIVTKDEGRIKFNDIDTASEWSKYYIIKGAEAGFVNGFPDGSFYPSVNITRAEAAQVALNVIQTSSRLAIFVNPATGNDANSGSISTPLKTITAAVKMARSNNKNMLNNLYVMLEPGEYPVDEQINMTAEDSGTNGYNIIYKTYGDGVAHITGGKHITGFSLYDSSLNIYRAKVDKSIASRQLFVNGVRAIRARSKTGLADCTTDNGEVGHTTTDTFLANYKHVQDLEMVYHEQWTNPRCGVNEIRVDGDKATLVMDQPGWQAVRNKGGTSVTTPVYYENAYELLDEEGEWYLDNYEGYLYYIPRSFEDMASADVVLPTTEQLFNITGTIDDSTNEPVHNITFENVSFEYTTWMRPSTTNGHSDAQNNHIRQSGVTEYMPGAAVYVRNATYVNFTGCTFKKLGISGLYLFGGIKNCVVDGNEFVDLSGTAISLGEPYTNVKNIVNPTEERYVIRNAKITNNYIHHIGVDYMSSAAISAGFPKDSTIAHNEIFDTPYSGMHIGYGWDGLADSATEHFDINANYIHSVMNNAIYDGGGIYLMGNTHATMEDPNLCRRNYLENIKNYYGALYPDEGTQKWKLTENVIDLIETPYWYGKGNNKGDSKWLHCWAPTIRNMIYVDNYSTTSNCTFKGTDSEFEDAHVYEDAAWPVETRQIVDEAGLGSSYLNKFVAPLQEVELKNTEYSLISGETAQIELSGRTRKKVSASVDGAYIYYRSSNTDVVQVDATGNMIAIGEGEATITVYSLINDILFSNDITVRVDDIFSTVKLNAKKIALSEGFSYDTKATALSKFGRTLEIEGISQRIADTSIATVDGNCKITGLAKGETTLYTTVTAEGKEITLETPVQVIGLDEQWSDDAIDCTEMLSDPSNWTQDNNVVKTKIKNGLEISTPGTLISYKADTFLNELLEFNLKIKATSGWPSICFRAQDTTTPYGSATMYMITFGQDNLQLQRFNHGTRTVIHGSVDGYESLESEGIPCDFKYNNTYRVKVGTRNEANGVRVLCYINNVKVLDYLDDTEGAIEDQGYVQWYIRSGSAEVTAVK